MSRIRSELNLLNLIPTSKYLTVSHGWETGMLTSLAFA